MTRISRKDGADLGGGRITSAAFQRRAFGEAFDRYFRGADNLRLFFLQSDVDEFEPYRTKLNDLILKDGTFSRLGRFSCGLSSACPAIRIRDESARDGEIHVRHG